MSKVPVPTLVPRGPQDRELVEALRQEFLHIIAALDPESGATAARPTAQLTTGQTFYDTTLSKPVWWNAATGTWKDAAGVDV